MNPNSNSWRLILPGDMVGSVSMVMAIALFQIFVSLFPLFLFIYHYLGDFTENYVGFTEFELLLPIQSKFWRTHIKFLLYFTVIGLTSIDTDVNGGGFCSIRRF